MHYNIEFYEDKSGKSDIIEYILELRKKKDNKEARIKLAKITSYIDQLSEKGLQLGQPYIKHIEGEIWELRPLRDRILFASWYNNKFILLSIFIKKQKKHLKEKLKKQKNFLRIIKKGVNKL